MFAVPGWSLGTLKGQQETASPGQAKRCKRKKPEVQWTDHRNLGVPKDKRKKYSPNDRTGGLKFHGTEQHIEQGEVRVRAKIFRADDELANRTKTCRHGDGCHESKFAQMDTQITCKPDQSNAEPAPPALLSRLTPLQTAMRQKLDSARFRHLNQTLYTSLSTEATALFNSNPSLFREYHVGFRQQVSAWPENPVDGFVRDLCLRGAVRNNKVDLGLRPRTKVAAAALPRRNGICTVADLGCGDAGLAAQLKEHKGLRLRILSYDLQSSNNLVIQADMANLPLEDAAVDVAILCLALMGTNWIEFVEEAWRILHWKGELWIAEIKSRFVPAKQVQVEHSVGKRRKSMNKVKDAKVAEHDASSRNEQRSTASEEEHVDLQAFVQILNSRGFTLQAENSIDAGNKMFVTLRFVKALWPSRGKYAGKDSTVGKRERAAMGFDNLGNNPVDEGKVLKPCFYKVR